MAYFIPSNIQKRFLRYALSRLELLDNESLDLDQLDIAWGSRSSVELRDVRLNVEKLCSLLHLPENLRPTKACILRLRVTIPADIYRSGIEIAIDGVEIQLKLSWDDAVQTEMQKKRRKRSREGNIIPNTSDDDLLPTAEDISQSFLKDEPLDERQELETAFTTQSIQMLEDSQALSETSEGDAGFGAGLGMSLPGFLSDILKGITDRLIVTISGVTFSLDADVPSDDSLVSSSSDSSVQVTVKFEIGSCDVEGLTKSITNPLSNVSKPCSKQGKRRLRLQNITTSLVSDATLFSQLDKFSDTSSPVGSKRAKSHCQSPSISSQGAESFSSPKSNRSVPSTPKHEVTESIPKVTTDSIQSQPAMRSQVSSSPKCDDHERFADSSIEDLRTSEVSQSGYLPKSEVIDSTHTVSHMFSSNVVPPNGSHDLNLSMSSHIQESLCTSAHQTMTFAEGSNSLGLWQAPEATDESLSTPGLSATAPATFGTLDPKAQISSHSDISRSLPIGSSSTVNIDQDLLFDPVDRRLSPSLSQHSSRSSSSNRSVGEDLAESKLFTSEEAESMYMSAMSDLHREVSTTEALDTEFPHRNDQRHPQTHWTESESRKPKTPEPIPPQNTDSSGVETPRPASPVLKDSQVQTIPSPTPPTDRPETPKPHTFMSSPTTSKTILAVDKIDLWVPWAGTRSSDPAGAESAAEDVKVESSTAINGQSLYNNMPGAFSMYSEATQRRGRRQSSPHLPTKSGRHQSIDIGSEERMPDESPLLDLELDVDVHDVDGIIDIATGKVLLSVAQQLASSFSAPPSDAKDTGLSLDSPSDTRLGRHTISVNIKRLSLSLIERLLETPNSPSSFTTSPHPATLSASAILRLDVKNASALYTQLGADISTNVDIQNFLLGFPDEHIISFDSDSAMRQSIRDLREQQKHDVSLTFRQSEDRGQEIHLHTLPVRVSFKMSKFDERLSCFGGLSGVLDLSSSIASNGTLQVPPSKKQLQDKVVHFAGQANTTSTDVLSTIKLNARISGVLFTLEGRACGLSTHTTAVKVTVRENYARVRIDRIKFSGPHRPSKEDVPLIAELDDTQLQFQLVPNEDDLDNLVSLITPSRDRYEDDDDILLDTLLRQRKKGSLIRVAVSDCHVSVNDIGGVMQFQLLGDEINKLSSVTKYLPEDDRPGILSMLDVENINIETNVDERIGNIELRSSRSRFAHIGFPALFALELGTVSMSRNHDDLLVGPLLTLQDEDILPMVMARQIGDELEPKLKVKLYNVVLEYSVPTLMAIMGLADEASVENLTTTMAASVVNIRVDKPITPLTRQTTDITDTSRSSTTALHLDLLLRDCALALNPTNSEARGLCLLSDSRITANMSATEELKVVLEIRKATMLAIDDFTSLDISANTQSRPKSFHLGSPAISDLCRKGYVSTASISSAEVKIQAAESRDGGRLLDVEIVNKLFVLETCADSLKTLGAIMSGLAPPTPLSKTQSYQTNVMPINDLMASFSGEAFEKVDDEQIESSFGADYEDDLLGDLPTNLDHVGSFYEPEVELLEASDAKSDSSRSTITITAEDLKPDPPFSEALQERFEFDPKITCLVIIENYLEIANMKGAARGWSSKGNKYGMLHESQIRECPLRLKVKLNTVIYNMFDGYDWTSTRETIAKAVEDVEEKAEMRRRQRQNRSREDSEEESEVGDFLFQSIWIAVPPNREPADLRKQINRQIDDVASETATTTTAIDSRTTRQPSLKRRKTRGLRLERGKKKISIELSDVDVDILVLPPGSGETQTSIDLRVKNLEVFDHVPSSTWNKFATCLIDPRDRQLDKSQIHLEILAVKPLPEAAASEFVVKASVLPLSLHIDQDTLDFAKRFMLFKDDSEPDDKPPSSEFFLQRLEVDAVPVRFDYKPKRIDYTGLRSGRTGELMNIVALDGADFVLKHLILYGVDGADQLHKMLNDIWMDDILTNQLPGVLAGLAPIRPFVNVGSGIRDLVVVPMREYRKDGRIVRSIQKGAVAFARTTASELARLGAKVAIGTQNVLQGTESLLSPGSSAQTMGFSSSSSRRRGIDEDWDDDFAAHSPGPEEKRVVSNYANQPLNVVTGVRAAYRGLERDLTTARDAIIAIGGEVRESESAQGVVGAVARHGATVILRPAIATTRAIGTALLGAGNMLDKDSKRKIEEKYKRY